MSSLEVTAILPHRAPMLLVDRVLQYIEGECLVATRVVALGKPDYPTDPEAANNDEAAYPAALVLESWCQAAGILATARRPSPNVLHGDVMLISSMTNARLHSPVWPGEVIEHRVRLVRVLDKALVFEGEVAVAGGRTVLTVDRLVMTMRPAASLLRSSSGERKEFAHE